jgi:hypothetical protein
MPSYTYTRGIPPRAKKETLEELKARIRKDIEERTNFGKYDKCRKPSTIT